jgi:hypothetical protein
MPALQARAAVFLTALWWGSLSCLGFVVVPLLFKHLGSPAEAGAMAAKLFSAQTWLSVACTMLLLLMLNRKDTVQLKPTSSVAKSRPGLWLGYCWLCWSSSAWPLKLSTPVPVAATFVCGTPWAAPCTWHSGAAQAWRYGEFRRGVPLAMPSPET